MTLFDESLPYPSRRQPVPARNAVEASQPPAAQVGLRMLLAGGNAVDAALASHLGRAEKLKTWSLDVPEKGLPKIALTQEDGSVITATFTLRDARVESTKVEAKAGKP